MMNKKWWLEEEFNNHLLRFQQVPATPRLVQQGPRLVCLYDIRELANHDHISNSLLSLSNVLLTQINVLNKMADATIRLTPLLKETLLWFELRELLEGTVLVYYFTLRLGPPAMDISQYISLGRILVKFGTKLAIGLKYQINLNKEISVER